MTKRTRGLLHKSALHVALLAGSVLFAFPFVWLVTTTFKGDEEIFSEQLNWVPKVPWYSAGSPYIDQRAYRPMRRPTSISPGTWDRAEPLLQTALWERARELAPETGIEFSAEAAEQVARGLWEQVRDTLPAETLSGDAQTVAEAAAEAVGADALGTVWNRVYKRAAIGKLRLLDAANRDLLAGEDEVAWSVGRAELEQDSVEIDGEAGRLLTYSDSAGGVTLEAALPVSGEIERVALGLHDDESWRHVDLTLVTPDGAFRSKNPFVMGNGEWQDVTWTFTPPRDRRSLEIVLEPTRVPRVPGRVPGTPYSTPEATAELSMVSPELPELPELEATAELSMVSPELVTVLLTIQPTSPWRATFDKFARNYREAIRYVPFWTFAKNSVLLVVLNILGQVFACSMVAYAFARLRWPGRDIIFVLLLSTMMLPPQVTMVPVFLIVRKLHWYNTLTPLWLPSFFGSAFFIFLLRQFFMTIPRDLEDAAKIDGCSYLGLYWRIMLPLVKPALAAVAIFQFLGSWNDFMGPLIYINDLRLTPLSLGLFQFQQEHAAEWGMLMAGSLLMTLPAIAIFFFAQKHFIQGVTLTGIKG